ncbi:GH32 C-terminal domain-containing protein [Neobacillus sp. C211]|uniref:GH32 C-terminal domain-containing protein n=1 Tax=unclassified Neobacillus TaxID=2675272 RepID=UPI00397D0B70
MKENYYSLQWHRYHRRTHLFVDSSSVKIFVNYGEEVITSRIFHRQSSRGIFTLQ